MLVRFLICVLWVKAVAFGVFATIVPEHPVDIGAKEALRQAAIEDRVKKGGASVVFLGDESVRRYETVGGAEWYKYFKQTPFEALNMGFDGERIGNVLWRLDNGALTGYCPKAVVISVGGNDILDGTPACDVILGLRDIIRRIQKKNTSIRILLTPLFPFGRTADSKERSAVSVVNRELASYANGRHVALVNFTDRLLTADGRLPAVTSADGRWPAKMAYDIWGSSLLPFLDAANEGRRLPGSLFPSRIDPLAYPPSVPAAAFPTGRFAAYSSRFGGNDWWAGRVERNRRQIAASGGRINLVMFGDSITHFMELPGPQYGSNVFVRLQKRYSVLNCGDAGDMTQHVLWRAQNGELDGYDADVITLMIGTNNAMVGDSAGDIAEGIRGILKVFSAKQPKARVVLMPVFPRGKSNDSRRPVLQQVNALIRPLADGRRVLWVDFNDKLVDRNGDVPVELAADGLHPTEKGYEVWMSALEPVLRGIR